MDILICCIKTSANFHKKVHAKEWDVSNAEKVTILNA